MRWICTSGCEILYRNVAKLIVSRASWNRIVILRSPINDSCAFHVDCKFRPLRHCAAVKFMLNRLYNVDRHRVATAHRRTRFAITEIKQKKKYCAAVMVQRDENCDMRGLISCLVVIYLCLQPNVNNHPVFARHVFSRHITCL